MKKMLLLVQLAALVLVAACARTPELIKKVNLNTRNDVFRETSAGTETPDGYVRVHILTSYKTPKKGAGDSLVINIDGQVVQIPDVAREENSGFGIEEPETGRGIRHSFSAYLLLKPGTHRVIAALPDHGCATEKEITLAAGSDNVLRLAVRYRTISARREISHQGTHFKADIAGLSARLNRFPAPLPPAPSHRHF